MAFFTFGGEVAMSTFRSNFGYGGQISIENIRNEIWPNSTSYRSLNTFRFQGVWRYRLLSSNASFGNIQMQGPFTGPITSDYTSPWFRSGDYSNMAFRAIPNYGRTFLGWELGPGGPRFATGTGTTGIAWNGTTQLILFARFA